MGLASAGAVVEGQYEVQVSCEMETGGGDVDQLATQRVSDQALLELIKAVFPTIDEMIDSVKEVRLTIKVNRVEER